MLQEAWHTPDLRPYGDRVLVGPWLASQHLQRARHELFRRDYEQGVLPLQNTRRMKANLLRPQTLAAPDALLRLGDVVQVLAPDMPAFSLAGGRGHLGVFLAGTVDDAEVDRCQFLSEGSRLHGSAQTEPCVRNAWRLCAEDGTARLDGCPLRLGQCFTLRAVEAGTRCPLYIRAQCNTTNEVGCGPPRLELSTTCDTYCRWRALHCDKHRRPETEGGTFPANMRLVLQHAASNLNLAASAGGKRHWVLTFFGRECKIGLRNYTDQYGQVTSENVWMLGVQRLRDRRTELPCPAPELYPPLPPPADPCPWAPDATCPQERACPPPPPVLPPQCPPPPPLLPPPCPPPQQRKSDCTADMPCQRDTKVTPHGTNYICTPSCP
ncbi:cilia- and flagella-associated protein 161-like [Frankliniella occidentalis]|uniref:Cilia- and flagella-associated protein 161-like n=1 Tax=Frankliniella occidentalis TaxID=133901 RepID=A0A9C6UE72_FRAOC|nr:cilia- and flagella-associated protein 161-like [Frankliniella occidentalis]